MEIQIYKDAFFNYRALYYATDRFCGNYNIAGEMKINARGNPIRYSSLRPIYALNILENNYFNENRHAFHLFELYNRENGLIFPGSILNIAFFELNKSEVKQKHTHWREYFLTGDTSKDAPAYIKKATQVIEHINFNKEEKEMYSELEKAQADYESQMYTSWLYGKNEGREEGIKEGRNEGINEVAINMLKNKMDIKFISKMTNLSIDVINRMNSELSQGSSISPLPRLRSENQDENENEDELDR
jgi:predicted transposase/invertase (TIGR01784 family)